MTGGLFPFAVLRLFAIFSFLAALVFSLYSSSPGRAFAGGWAICSGVALAMIFSGTPIVGPYLRVSPDPHYGTVIDVAFSVMLAYLGGVLARNLNSQLPPNDDG